MVAFSALTLLVVWQEGHLARKKWVDGGGEHWLVRMEWRRRPAGWSVCLPLLILPCTIKSRSSLLAPAHPGGPGKQAVKWLCVCCNGCFPGESELAAVALLALVLNLFGKGTSGDNWHRHFSQDGCPPCHPVNRVLKVLRKLKTLTSSSFLHPRPHYHHFMAIIQDDLVSRHPQLRTRGFCWREVLLPTCPC